MQGRTTARGYGYRHQQERKRWVLIVASGTVVCWRCGRLIVPGTAWDLGHDDSDRTRYRGPEHALRCNRRAGASKGGRVIAARRRAVAAHLGANPSRNW